MENLITDEDRKKILEGIRNKYRKVALGSEGNFQYPTGRAGLEALHYDPEILKALPEDVLASYCGVGNPFSMVPINAGESILDIGSGAGVDAFVAAIMVGPRGKVVGIDLTLEMIERARENLRTIPLHNVSFMEASAEEIPFPDESFHAVISNGVFNLIPDKARALKEVFRVIKPGGGFFLADQLLQGKVPNDSKTTVENWAR